MRDHRPPTRWTARAGGCLLAAVVLASVAALGALATARATGHQLIAVRGASMGRALPLGSLAVAERVPAREVHVGDVVLVASTGRSPFVHRIRSLVRERAKTVVTTQGDANRRPEEAPYVLPATVVRVRGRVPYAGYAATLAATDWARMVALTLLVALGAAGALRRLLTAPEGGPAAAPAPAE